MLDSIERMFDQVNPDPWRPGTRGGPEERDPDTPITRVSWSAPGTV